MEKGRTRRSRRRQGGEGVSGKQMCKANTKHNQYSLKTGCAWL